MLCCLPAGILKRACTQVSDRAIQPRFRAPLLFLWKFDGHSHSLHGFGSILL